MAFETKPLLLHKVRWQGDRLNGGLFLPNGSLIKVDDSGSGLRVGELASALQFILQIGDSNEVSVQALILASRTHAAGIRLIAFAKAFQFLGRYRLIKNAEAYPWLDLLRDDYSWRESYSTKPILKIAEFEIPSGKSWRELSQIFIFLIAGAGLWFGRSLWSNLIFFAPLPADSFNLFGIWAMQGLLTISIARTIKAGLQALFIRGLTGQGQSLTMQLSPISLALTPSSLGDVERKTVWEGLAALAALFSIAALTVFAKLSFVFVAIVFVIELSPFAQSTLLQTLRHFYSLSPEENEKPVAFAHSFLGFLWSLLAAGLTLKIILIFQKPLREFLANRGDMAAAQWVGFAFFVWLIVSLLASWIDDVASATIFGLDSDRQALREAFHFGTRKATERPLRSASEIHESQDWKRTSFLRQVDESTRAELLRNASLVTYPEGARLCHQGRRERELYILLSGEAGVFKRSASGRERLAVILSEGSAFGEVGYFLNEPRTADVKALRECVALVLRPSPDNKIGASDRFSNLQMRIWFLQALQLNSMFRNLPSEALDRLLLQGEFIRKQPNETFFKAGDAADGCYFIVQGQGRVYQGNLVINQVQQGDVLGEVALLLSGARRTATVVADSEMLALFLSLDSFWQVISEQFSLGLAIENLAEIRLRDDQLRKRSV